MIDMTYDPEADAVYLRLSRGKVAATDEAGPFAFSRLDMPRLRRADICQRGEN